MKQHNDDSTETTPEPSLPVQKTESPHLDPSTYIRIDKWLWATRIFKTRKDAAEACRSSAIRLNDTPVKPSTRVRKGDTITARIRALTRTLYVVGLAEKRVGAVLLPDYFEDRTPEEAYELAREKRADAKLFNQPGTGRPTKKDRRAIEHFNNDHYLYDFEQ